MAISIAEKIHDVTTILQRDLSDTLYKYSVIVHDLITKRVPISQNVDFDLINKYVDRIDTINEQLRNYRLFHPGLENYCDEVDGALAEIADRFKKWMKQSTMTTNEACEKFGKSKSTIYRWIKSGKLIAQKIDGRWLIVDKAL